MLPGIRRVPIESMDCDNTRYSRGFSENVHGYIEGEMLTRQRRDQAVRLPASDIRSPAPYLLSADHKQTVDADLVKQKPVTRLVEVLNHHQAA